MGMLTIDKEKCRRDGLCAADCPTGVIRFDGADSYPELVPDGDAMCLRCGHCVAVCPHGAMDHVDVPLASCAGIDPALTLSLAQAEQFLRRRRSVRRFKRKPVERAALQRLIEIARYAPTGSNMQLVEWVVMTDAEQLKALSARVIEWMRGIIKADPQCSAMPYAPMLVRAWENGTDAILRGAPGLVVAMAPEQDRNGMVDLTLALSYLELAAPAFNIGTCWAGLLQGALMANPALKASVGIPRDYPHHYPMMIGYSKATYHRLPERKTPKITWK